MDTYTGKTKKLQFPKAFLRTRIMNTSCKKQFPFNMYIINLLTFYAYPFANLLTFKLDSTGV